MSQESQEIDQEVPVPEEKDELTKLKEELSESKDKYFRALAEAENMRKRLQKEKVESQSYAIGSVILDFLQPLDHFEQALQASQGASDEVKKWVVGFQMILNQCKQVLFDNGVVALESVGQQFDPHMHEAIETEETTTQAEGTVIQEFSRGYKMGSRVIRPAKVKVAIAPTSSEQESK
ncbi:MAG: nucleotide exchange factor GrpE [Verrucomicrobia bacterium]|nr:nucleotide exchange factor GrpE [Verrucomicrobiota bacterium]